MPKSEKSVFDQCVALARQLRSLGLPEAELRKSVDALEAKLIEEERASDQGRYPEGATDRDRARADLERASQGLPSLNGKKADHRKGLSAEEINSINFARACNGEPDMSPDEIRRETLRRANPLSEDEAQRYEYAPKGMHPTAIARENLRRAVSGEPELIARPTAPTDDAEGE